MTAAQSLTPLARISAAAVCQRDAAYYAASAAQWREMYDPRDRYLTRLTVLGRYREQAFWAAAYARLAMRLMGIE